MAQHRFFAHMPLTMLPELFPRVSKLPVGLELAVDHVALSPAFADEAKRLGEAILAAGMPCRFHAPFRNLCPGGHDPEAVALSRRRIEAAIELAPRFGVETLVAHPAWGPDGDALDGDGFLGRSAEFWLALVDSLESNGCRIGLENVFDRDPAILAGLLKRLPEERYGATFDIGHWHAYSKAGLDDWFAAIGHRIIGLHVHDNGGVADEHLAIGGGTVDWVPFLEAARALGRGLDWVLENRSLEDLQQSFEFFAKGQEIMEFSELSALVEQIGALREEGPGAP